MIMFLSIPIQHLVVSKQSGGGKLNSEELMGKQLNLYYMRCTV